LSRQVLIPQATELDAFARLMRAHSTLRRELAAQVLTPRGLTLNDFEALVHLSRADGNRLRRVDLVDLLMLTPSGVTRLLDGLEQAGLVESVNCASDARVHWAQLTEAGVGTIECVAVEHAEVLRSLFCGTLAEEELAQLAELLGRLPGAGTSGCAT
jgi:DNA-binding MarR family transcriptional regulator